MSEGPPRGRGAGVNKPAWMVQKEREEAAVAAAAAGAGGGDGKDNGGEGKQNDGRGGGVGDNNERGGGDDHGRYADADERGGGRDRVEPQNDGRGGGGGDNSERGGGGDHGPHADAFGRVGRGGGGSHDRGGGARGGDNRDYDDRRDRDNRGGGGRRDDYNDRRDHRGGGRRDDFDDRRRGGGGGRQRSERPRRPPSSGIYFHSYEEERAWLDDRRRKRRGRKSVFDIEPTAEQLAEDEARAALEQSHTLTRAGGAVGATGANMGINSSGGHYGGGGGGRGATMQPQQTRHARRLYIGNIPDLSEEHVHNFFRDAIRDSIILDPSSNPNASGHRTQYVTNDPIISVYINRERRFAFLEFKTMEITTACLSLDGIDVMGQGKVKVKRPNDYNAALAPIVNSSTAPTLDTAKLGIVCPTVADGPNKIFIGGLPYHLAENQVLELLGAFGAVRAFHLVKQDANATTSKGYCFVEYSDPNITQVACIGLNGMDMGGGKQLSCRMAAQQFTQNQGVMEIGGGAFSAPVAALPAQTSVVDGVDVDALLSAAMGGGAPLGMPGVNPAASMGPMGGMMMQHQQQPVAATMGVMPGMQMGMNPMAGMIQPPQQQQPQGLVVTDPMAVANAAASALDMAFGGSALAAPMAAPVPAMPVQHQAIPSSSQAVTAPTATRVLVLLNMVMDEDLATSEDHKMLKEEVGEEVSRYGKLLSMKIPRHQDGYAPTATKKIFLEYATPKDAMNAERELKGRAFGPNVVDAMFFDEEDYAKGNLS